MTPEQQRGALDLIYNWVKNGCKNEDIPDIKFNKED